MINKGPHPFLFIISQFPFLIFHLISEVGPIRPVGPIAVVYRLTSKMENDQGES